MSSQSCALLTGRKLPSRAFRDHVFPASLAAHPSSPRASPFFPSSVRHMDALARWFVVSTNTRRRCGRGQTRINSAPRREMLSHRPDRFRQLDGITPLFEGQHCLGPTREWSSLGLVASNLSPNVVPWVLPCRQDR